MATEIVLDYQAKVTDLINDIQRVIDKNNELLASTKGVNAEFNKVGKPVKSATKNVKGLTNATNKQTSATKKLTSAQKKYNAQTKKTGSSLKGIGGIAGRIGVALAAAFSVQALIQFGKQAIRTAADLQAVRISLDFIEGSAEGGADTFNFLKDITEEFGLELVSTVKAFRSFSGATRLAGFSAQETQTSFRDVSSAVVALGLNAQQADRVFLALSQIVSKGVVSAEELRRQLGDALPGAFSIAAQSVGKTEAEFNKLLATGKILSQDFLPPFTKLLRETFAPGVETGAKSLNAELNRLQNQVTELSDKLGKQLAPAWLLVSKAVLQFADDSILSIKNLIAPLRALGDVYLAIFNADPKGVLKALNDIDNSVRGVSGINIKDEFFNEEILDASIRSIQDRLKVAEQDIIKAQLVSLKDQEKNLEDSFDKKEISQKNYNDEIEKIDKERLALQDRSIEREVKAAESLILRTQKVLDKQLSKPLPEEVFFGGEIFKTGQDALDKLEEIEQARNKLFSTVPAGFKPEEFFNDAQLRLFNNELGSINTRLEIFTSAFDKDGFTNINIVKGLQAQIKFLDKQIDSLDKELFPVKTGGGIEKATIELLDYQDLLKKSLLEVARISDEQSKIFSEATDKDVKKAAKANLTIANRAFKTLEKIYKDAREKRQKAIDDFREGTDDLGVVFTAQIQEALAKGVDAEDVFGILANKLVDNLEGAKKLIDAQVPDQIKKRVEQEFLFQPVGETGPRELDLEKDKQRELEITAEVQAETTKKKIIEDEKYADSLEFLVELLKKIGFITEETNTKQAESWVSTNAEILRSSSALFSQLATLSSTITDARIDDLNRERDVFLENLDLQREALEDDREKRLITEAQLQSGLEELDNKDLANKERIDKEVRRLRKQQAVLDKSAAIFEIGVNTAIGISDALKNSATAPIIVPIISALGAAQIATVLATPIPKFAMGTKGTKESGLAEVGERGRETVFLPQGSKVLNAGKTKRYGEVIDAMADNKFDDYINKYHVAPVLMKHKKVSEDQKSTDFAQNVANSVYQNGLSYYDLIDANKKGVKVTNLKELTDALKSDYNSRRV